MTVIFMEIDFWATMVDTQSMKQIFFIGNMQIQYFFFFIVYGIGDFTSLTKRNQV